MEKREYRIMHELEGTHWWYRGLHALVRDMIRSSCLKGDCLRVLDGGCGTGGFARFLNGGSVVTGIDISEEATVRARNSMTGGLARASVCRLPFRDNVFDAVVSLDVLYHRNVHDDGTAVEEFMRVLKAGGVLIMNLPAGRWLKSGHDEAVHGKRRYARKDLLGLLGRTGFEPEIVSFRNTFLFVPAVIRRLAGRMAKGAQTGDACSDLWRTPRFMNVLFRGLIEIENRIIPRLPLPFGLSLFCVARKGAVR